MAKVRVASVEMDTEAVQAFVDIIQKGRGSFTDIGLKDGARYLRGWYVQRFSKGGFGSWRGLSKKYKQIKPWNKDRILILSGQLMNAIDVLVVGRLSYSVGYVGVKAGKQYVNPVKDPEWLRKIYNFDGTVADLAEYHQPVRPIIVEPPLNVQRGIAKRIEAGVNRDVQRANRRAGL